MAAGSADLTLSGEYHNWLVQQAREIYREYLRLFLETYNQSGYVAGTQPLRGRTERMLALGADAESTLEAAVGGATAGERSVAQKELRELIELELEESP